MRDELKKLGTGKSHTFTARVVRFGQKPGNMGRMLTTVLLQPVKHKGKVVTDHLWVTLSEEFKSCNIKKGDIVRFDGEVTSYIKGYMGLKNSKKQRWDIELKHPLALDYMIERPTKIKVIKSA